MKTILAAVLLGLSILSLAGRAAEVREWKTADGGKTIAAEYVSAKDGKVTIRRSDNRKVFTIALDTLSEADREWVAKRLEEDAEQAAKSDKSGPFAKLLTGEWEKTEGHGLEYRIFGARKLRGANEKGHPLVIYLHGRGGDVMSPEQPGEARSFSEEDNYRKRTAAPVSGVQRTKSSSV